MLMSMFDPSNSKLFLSMWMILIMPLMFQKFNKFKKVIYFFFMKEFYKNSIYNKKMMEKINISIFMLFFLLNSMNMIPYSFIITSQIQTNLFINLTLWFSMLTFSLKNFMKNLMIKLTPISTPLLLMPFMVLIELISFLIRPITLTLRLTANMIAGHILMMLTTKMFFMNFFFIIPLLILSFLELMMAFLQSFILFTLFSLYFNDLK